MPPKEQKIPSAVACEELSQFLCEAKRKGSFWYEGSQNGLELAGSFRDVSAMEPFVKRVLIEFHEFPPVERCEFLRMSAGVGRDPSDFEIIADKVERGRAGARRKIMVRDRTTHKTYRFYGLDGAWVVGLRVKLGGGG